MRREDPSLSARGQGKPCIQGSSALSAEKLSGITAAPFVALKIEGLNHVALHDCSNLALQLRTSEGVARRPNVDLPIDNSSLLGRHSEFGDCLAHRPSNKFMCFFCDYLVRRKRAAEKHGNKQYLKKSH